MTVDQWLRDHAGQGYAYVHPKGGQACSMQCPDGEVVEAASPSELVSKLDDPVANPVTPKAKWPTRKTEASKIPTPDTEA